MPRPAPADSTELPIRLSLTAAVLVGLLTPLAGPSNWLWGANLLRFYPGWVGPVLGALTLAMIWLLPPVEDDSWLPRLLLRIPPGVTALVVAIAGFFAFILARAHSFLLGDGLEITRRVHQGAVAAPRSALYNVLAPAFKRAVAGNSSPAVGLALQFVSFTAGTLALFAVAWLLARVARRHAPAALTAAAFLLLNGSMQLFCGYIESYPLLGMSMLVFYAAAFDRVTGGGRGPLLLAMVAAVTAGLSHPFGLTLAPPAFYLLAGRPVDGRYPLDRRLLRTAGLVLIVAVAADWLFFTLNPSAMQVGRPFRFLAPQVGILDLVRSSLHMGRMRAWARYSNFSLVHLADILNTLWITGAAALAAVLGALTTRAGRRAMTSPATRLALLSLLGLMFGRVIWRTPLGALRDWDLFSGIGFALAAVASGVALAGPARRMAGAAMAASLFFLVPWIGLQMSTERAARRHLEAVDAPPPLEPIVRGGFHGVMGDRFASIMSFDLAARAYHKALSYYPRTEYWWRLATVYMAAGRNPEAVRALNELLKMEPDNVTGLVTLGEVSIAMDRLAAADSVLDLALKVDPRFGPAWVQKARVKYGRLDRTGALADLARADSLIAPDDLTRRDLVRLRDQIDEDLHPGLKPAGADTLRLAMPPGIPPIRVTGPRDTTP